MGKKRGVILPLLAILVGIISIISSSSVIANVDVVSNGEKWYYCSATNPEGTKLVDAEPLKKYDILPLFTSAGGIGAKYLCINSAGNPCTLNSIATSIVADSRFCDMDNDGHSDWEESNGNSDCLFSTKQDINTMHIFEDFNSEDKQKLADMLANCDVCNAKVQTGDKDCPDGNCVGYVPVTNPASGGDIPLADCTNKKARSCAGGDAILDETVSSCVNGIDNDADGKTGCKDPDCVQLCYAEKDHVCTDIVDQTKKLDCVAEKGNDCISPSTGQIDCMDPDCKNFFKECSVPSTLDVREVVALPNSFMCYDDSGSDFFAECCPSGICNNFRTPTTDDPRIYDINRNFITGTQLYSVFTVDSIVTSTSGKDVLARFVRPFTYNSGECAIQQYLSPTGVFDWDPFDNINIDLMFNDPQNIDELTFKIGKTTETIVTFTGDELKAGSFNGWAPYRWHHISLSLDKFKQLPNADILSHMGESETAVGLVFKRNVCSSSNSKVLLRSVTLTKNSELPRYCAAELKNWTYGLNPDLSSITGSAREKEINTYRIACDANPAYGWTGTKCCGVEPHKYWADAFNIGCWDSYQILSGELVNDTINQKSTTAGALFARIMYDKAPSAGLAVVDTGKFYVCGYDTYAEFKVDFANTTEEKDMVFQPDCSIQRGYFCDPSNPSKGWSGETVKDQTGVVLPADRSEVSKTSDGSSYSCCPKDHCYDGTTCVKGTTEDISEETETENPMIFSPAKDGAVCMCTPVDAEHPEAGCVASWTKTNKMYDWYGTTYGYCEEPTQCWKMALEGDDEAGCVDSGYYMQDHYCKEGAWSTRTAIVAKELYDKFVSVDANQAVQDFTLFCDNRQYFVLNSPMDVTTQENSNFNGFCTLSFKKADGTEHVVIGTSLNVEEEDNPAIIPGHITEYLEASGSQYPELKTPINPACMPAARHATFSFCNDEAKDNHISFYYDDATKIVAFSDTDANLMQSSKLTFFDSISTWLSSIFNKAPTDATKQKAISDILSLSRYDHIYVQRKGDVQILGYLDTINMNDDYNAKSAVVIEYNNLATDMSSAYGKLKDRHNPANSIMTFYPGELAAANGRRDYQRIYVVRPHLPDQTADAIWAQLTAQLRVQDCGADCVSATAHG